MSLIEKQDPNVAADAAAYLRALLEELETFDGGIKRAFDIAEGYLYPAGETKGRRRISLDEAEGQYRAAAQTATEVLRGALEDAERVLMQERERAAA